VGALASLLCTVYEILNAIKKLLKGLWSLPHRYWSLVNSLLFFPLGVVLSYTFRARITKT
jgi:hypothetical protein